MESKHGVEAQIKLMDKNEQAETPTTIAADQNGIEISFDGRPAILIERRYGKVRLYAWASHSEDATHVIDFEGAKEAA